MPTTIIQVKNSGPSKKFPDKYGWVLDTTGKFWNVTIVQANAAKKGQTYTVQSSTNARGFEQVDGWRLADTQEMLEASVNGGHPRSEPITHKNGAEAGLDKKLEQQWAEKIFDAFLNGHTENQIREARQVGQKLAREATMNQDGPQKPEAAPAGTFQDSGDADEGVWLK